MSFRKNIKTNPINNCTSIVQIQTRYKRKLKDTRPYTIRHINVHKIILKIQLKPIAIFYMKRLQNSCNKYFMIFLDKKHVGQMIFGFLSFVLSSPHILQVNSNLWYYRINNRFIKN